MRITEKWDILLKDEYDKPYFIKLEQFIENEYQRYTVYPKKEDLYAALKLTNFENIKVIIIGQDPYHNSGQAHGIGFSVLDDIKVPPSLFNIFKELQNDLNIMIPKSGNLTKWAKQGVLLLNSVLTVREGEPTSHQGVGWEMFTSCILQKINEKTTPVVFILWGNYAKEKARIITNSKHLIIEGTHPSPLSCYRGFFGGKYFSKCNDFLKKNQLEIIDWDLNK